MRDRKTHKLHLIFFFLNHLLIYFSIYFPSIFFLLFLRKNHDFTLRQLKHVLQISQPFFFLSRSVDTSKVLHSIYSENKFVKNFKFRSE